MTRDERISVLEGLLEKVRQSARDRGLALPSDGSHGLLRVTASPRLELSDEETAAPSEKHAGLVDSNGAPQSKPKLLSFEDAPSEARTAVSSVPAHVAIAAAAAARGGLVRFDGAFAEEPTSVGDPDQIEALALADAHAAEQGRDSVDEAPDADGPITLPPAASVRAPEPVLVRTSARPSAPLALADLEEEFGDSLPPQPTDAPAAPGPAPLYPTSPIAPPAYVGPPMSDRSPPMPPAYVASPASTRPAVAPPAYVPPSTTLIEPPPFAEPSRRDPPSTTRSGTEPPAAIAPPPRVADALQEAEPASTGYVDVSELDVIELDEAELIQSTPPETSLEPLRIPSPQQSEEGEVFDRPTRLSDATGIYGDAEADEDGEPFDPVTLPPSRALAPLAEGQRPTSEDEDVPASERKPRDVARPLDDALPDVDDEELAPESGEALSQRYPTNGREAARAPLSDSPDAPTPIPPPDDTAEVRALGSVDVVDRPMVPALDPILMTSARARPARTFGELLDDALSLGAPPPSL